MNLRVSVEFGLYFARIPLISAPGIRNANALRLDWNDVLPAERCSYVLGNPPFVGAMLMNQQQRDDMQFVFSDLKGYGVLDFVTAWYWKAVKYLRNTQIKVALVSTNSITQGEQVGLFWGPLLGRFNIHITFAHQSFQWNNEAKGVAAVHCVIIGFSEELPEFFRLFEYATVSGPPLATVVSSINPYLVDASTILLINRKSPICAVPEMRFGSMPRDDGNFVLSSQEKDDLIKAEPDVAQWIRPYIGAQEFLNKGERWCLWLVKMPPNSVKAMPRIYERIQRVRDFRAASNAASTRKFATTPTLFCQIAQPESNYLLIPSVSSERRTYVPIGFLPKDVIASNAVLIIPEATLFHFGVITSAMHNAFMRLTCGRMKSDFRYSKDIVYNNFPWPGFASTELSDKHRTAIEQAAQCVLDARAQFASASLADLYDPLTMHPALLKAHQKLDTAVDAAYQPSGGKKTYATDAERVAFLFDLYQRITSLLPAAKPSKAKRQAKAVA